MLDRASTFADKTVLTLLKNRFVTVAIDQWYTRRQQDTEGEFWRNIAGQGPRNDSRQTQHGLYLAGADGQLLAYTNNRGPDRIRGLLEQAALEYSVPSDVVPLQRTSIDQKYKASLPVGAAVVRVRAKVEGGYAPTDDRWEQLFQSAVSRDNLWITAEEQASLAGGTIPEAFAIRLLRFHLVDNTRGEPPIWTREDIRQWSLTLEDGGQLSGTAHLETADGSRGYQATLRGELAWGPDQKLQQLHIFVEGQFWGSGPFTRTPPAGKLPLVIAFSLADGSDPADSIAPHGSRGWLDGYLRP